MHFSDYVDEIARIINIVTTDKSVLPPADIWIAGPVAQGMEEPENAAVLIVPEQWIVTDDPAHALFADALAHARERTQPQLPGVQVQWLPWVMPEDLPPDYATAVCAWSRTDTQWQKRLSRMPRHFGDGPQTGKLDLLVPLDLWRFSLPNYELLRDLLADGSVVLTKIPESSIDTQPTYKQDGLLRDQAFISRFFEKPQILATALGYLISQLPQEQHDGILWYERRQMTAPDGSLKLHYGELEIGRMLYDLANCCLKQWIGYPASSAAERQLYIFQRSDPDNPEKLARFRERLRRLDRMDGDP